MRRGLGGRGRFPPLVRVQIEQLACCAPAGVGLALTHWSTRALATVAAARGIVPQIAHSTVALILQAADMQPQRARYWTTPTLNATFVERASKILWCYEHVDHWEEQGEVILCFDEKPTVQALQRGRPTQGLQPGHIERIEFEDKRHGTVNFAVALLGQEGQRWGWGLDRNDSDQVGEVLAELFTDRKEAEKIHLIWDGGPSPGSQATSKFLRAYRGWVRVWVTPPHASWLNQAELLLRAFSARYLHRGDWQSRGHLIRHLESAIHEYNSLFAHPFTWSWTRRDMRRWIERQQARLP